LLRTGPGYDIDPRTPGFGLFDHAVVYIPGDPGIWIDPTARYLRPGELPLAAQNRWALIADHTTTELVRTPASQSSDNHAIEVREFHLPQYGKARVVETSRWSGSLESEIRAYHCRQSPEDLRKGLEEYAKEAYMAARLTDLQVSDCNDLSKTYEIRLEIVEAAFGMVDEREAMAVINLGSLFHRLPWVLRTKPEEPADPRPEDLEVYEPFIEEWRYRIVPPVGFSVRDLPPEETRRLGPATFTSSFRAGDDGVVTGTIRLDTGKRRLTPEEVAEFRDGVSELVETAQMLVWFSQKGEELLEAGRIREALEEFRRLQAMEPEQSIHRARIARTLLAAGLGARAREEARGAIQQAPDSALAYRTLAWILEHDLVGRRFEKGFDYDGALAAYRKAMELDPEDIVPRTAHAILLTYNSAGEEYGRGARVDEAIREYEEILEKEPDAGVRINLLVAYARSRQFKALAQHLAEIDSDDIQMLAFHVAARAVNEGVTNAVGFARNKIADPDQRREVVRTAAATLMQCREYVPAGDLFMEAARGSPDPARLLSLAQLLRGVQRYEEVELPEDSPSTLVRRLFLGVLTGVDQGRLAEVMSHHAAAEVQSPESVEELRKVMRQLRYRFQQIEVPMETFTDFMLAAMRTSAEGSDDAGYRVHTELSGSKMTFIVLKEGGEYRVLTGLGVDSGDSYVAAEILDRVQDGRLDEARQLLDWIREEANANGGDDPLGGHLIVHFWQKRRKAGADEIRQAAAVLMADAESSAGEAISILEDGREKAATEDEAIRFDLALAHAYMASEQYAKMIPIARRLVEARSDSVTAFGLLVHSLIRLERWDETTEAIRQRLVKMPGDTSAHRAAMDMAERQIDLEGMRREAQILQKRGALTPTDYNNLAWTALIADRLDPEAIDHIRRAVSSPAGISPESLHTLAAIYAEQGQTTEAREVLLQSIKLDGLAEPEPQHWYVFGRIAEHFGAEAAAAEMFNRVEKPQDPWHLSGSTYVLAQRRLEQ
jgi:tetratricopeptide (TPR) repeat protein